MIDSPDCVISFPGGAGGNWLLYFLYNVPVDGDRINFHDHIWYRSFKTKIRLEHELDPSKFNFLYSGTAYLNFYLNVMFKFFHWDLKIFEQKSYQEYFLLSVNTARFICKFKNIKDHIFFNSDSLILDPKLFYETVRQFKKDLELPDADYKSFLDYREAFLATNIRPNEVFENFDNFFWITFVLGYLMNENIVPTDFVISNPENFDDCKNFVKKHYQRNDLTNWIEIPGGKQLPCLI